MRIVGGALAALVSIGSFAFAGEEVKARRLSEAARRAAGADVKAQIRAKVAAGQIDPRTLIYPIDSSVVPGAPPPARIPSSTGGASPGGFPLDVDYFDDFSTYELTDCTNPPESLTPIDNQINPAGFVWMIEGEGDFVGVADDGVILEAGGAPPMGDPLSTGEPAGAFLAAPRATCGVGLETEFPGVYGDNHHDAFIGQFRDPLRASNDFYLTDIANGQWWSPTDFVAGFIVTRIFLGGENIEGALSSFLNEDGVLDRVVVLGWQGSQDGEFYAPPSHPAAIVPENEWFTIMLHMSVGTEPGEDFGYSVWIKTQSSVGGEGTPEDPQFLDPRMADGSIPPVDGDPDGWIDVFPGHPDDHDVENEPLPEPTPGVVEGIGFAENIDGQSAELLTGDIHLQQARPLAAVAVTGLQQGFVHSDPEDADPETFPQDAFWDNYTASGMSFEFMPCEQDLGGPEVICPSTGDSVPGVDGADLGILLGEWGSTGDSPSDLNGDFIVDGADLGILLGAWGPCPYFCPDSQ